MVRLYNVLTFLAGLSCAVFQTGLLREGGAEARFLILLLFFVIFIFGSRKSEMKVSLFGFSFLLLGVYQIAHGFLTGRVALVLNQGIISICIFYVALSLKSLKRSESRFLFLGLICAALINLPMSVLQYFEVQAVSGFMFNPNSLASWSIMLYCLLLIERENLRLPRLLETLILLALLTMILLSGSNTYIALIPLALLTYFLHAPVQIKIPVLRHANRISIFIGGSLIYLTTLALVVLPRMELSGFDSRGIIWKRSLELIAENPFFGCGAGRWYIEFAGLSQNGLESAFGRTVFLKPHNEFIRLSTENGVFGILLIFFLLGLLIWAIRSKNDLPGIASLFGVFCLVIDMTLHFTLMQASLIILVVLLLEHFFQHLPGARLNKWLILGIGLSAFVYWAAFNLNSLRFKRSFGPDHQQADAINTSIYPVDPISGSPVHYLEALNTSSNEGAYDLLSESLNAHPHDAKAFLLRANISIRIPDKNSAQADYLNAIRLCPCFTDARIDYSTFLYRKGEIKEAISVLEGVCRHNQISANNLRIMRSEAREKINGK